MKITYDPNKNALNIQKHGLSFEDVIYLDWDNALCWQDIRFDYGEMRFSALVPLNGRLHFVAYTDREDGRRIITFRKTNDREKKYYAQNH